MRCAVCGRDELLPFTCAYCGEHFCAEHRLPEKHNCLGIHAAKSPEEIKRREKTTRIGEDWGYIQAPQPRVVRRTGLGRMGREEPLHLLVGAALVALVGYSLHPGLVAFPMVLGFLLVGYVVSFMLHEVAHKLMAQSKGLLAEFRIYPLGAVITAVTAILPFLKVIAPGAVRIVGATTRDEIGVIALVGPLTNIILAVVFSTLSAAIRWFPLGYLAYINAFIAFFNLIPFPPLDGQKIISWNVTVWAVMFVASLALMFLIRI